MRRTITFASLLMCVLLLLPACQKRPAGAADVSTAIPYDMKVGVVPFSQPTTVSELITGFIPEKQGRIPADALSNLDGMLRSTLSTTKRLYTWIPYSKKSTTDMHDSVSPMGLGHWLNVARQYKIDLMLVPMIMDWHQRQGSSAGVTESAHVRAEFFLLDVRNGRVLRRSIYEEKQVGLADDMTKMGSFFRRKGSCVEAEVLAQEAMDKAVKELGL